MSNRKRARISPHSTAVDPSPYDGVSVLGESLGVLMSALLKLKVGTPRDGLVEVEAIWPWKEGDAIERAMARSERKIPGDSRTQDQQNADRFAAVIERVIETYTAILAAGSKGAA